MNIANDTLTSYEESLSQFEEMAENIVVFSRRLIRTMGFLEPSRNIDVYKKALIRHSRIGDNSLSWFFDEAPIMIRKMMKSTRSLNQKTLLVQCEKEDSVSKLKLLQKQFTRLVKKVAKSLSKLLGSMRTTYLRPSRALYDVNRLLQQYMRQASYLQ